MSLQGQALPSRVRTDTTAPDPTAAIRAMPTERPTPQGVNGRGPPGLCTGVHSRGC